MARSTPALSALPSSPFTQVSLPRLYLFFPNDSGALSSVDANLWVMTNAPICERCNQPKLPVVYLPAGSGTRIEDGTLYLDVILDISMPEWECLCDIKGAQENLGFAPQTHESKFSIFVNDITKLFTDAVVNAANGELRAGGGVCGAIHRAAGPELERECHELYPEGVEDGGVAVTRGFNSNAKFIIHAVAPRSTGNGWGDIEVLLDAYRNAILVADELGCKSISIPSLGTGIYGWDVAKVAEPVIREAIQPLLSQVKNLEMIILCCFTEADAEIYTQAVTIPFKRASEDKQTVSKNLEDSTDIPIKAPAAHVRPVAIPSGIQEDIVVVWFYVNPQDDSIEGVFSFFPLGMFMRTGGDWEYITREESPIDTELAHFDIYQLRWDTDEVVVDESFLGDDFDGDHIAVKMYDSGELNISELVKYAVLKFDHRDIVYPEIEF